MNLFHNIKSYGSLRKRVWLSLAIAVLVLCSIYYLIQLGDVRDISADVEERLPKPNSQLSIDDLAKELGLRDWSSVCAVVPYASVNLAKNVPTALRDETWIGNWNESEWRIVLLEADKIALVAIIKNQAVRLIVKEPSGIVCYLRSQEPHLRPIKYESGYEITAGKG